MGAWRLEGFLAESWEFGPCGAEASESTNIFCGGVGGAVRILLSRRKSAREQIELIRVTLLQTAGRRRKRVS